MAAFPLRHPILILLLFSSMDSTARAESPCFGHVDPAEYPTCQLIDHARSPGTSYQCLTQWENSVYILKDGNVTLDCSAPFPLDVDFEGVKPIKNLQVEFYKGVPEVSSGGDGNPTENLRYGVKVHLLAKNIEYSGDYIFHPLGKPEKKVVVYVFAEKKDLPQFLDLKDGKPVLDAYVDPTDPTSIIIPCRSANYNAKMLGLYLNYEDLKAHIDGVNLRYDPRRGFIRKIPPEDSEVNIYGLYECYTEWKSSGRDRKKVLAKNPSDADENGSVTEDPEGHDHDEHVYDPTVTSTETPKQTVVDVAKIQGLITFHPVPNKRWRAECVMPPDLVKGHTPFFASALLDNPTSALLNVKCSHLDSSCGENVRVMGNITKPPNFLEIHLVQPQGLVQCAITTSSEILEYFTGADDHIYFDWNEALAKDALVKVIPADPNVQYTPLKTFQFICRFPEYVAVYPVWWALKYNNGTFVENYEFSASKSYTLDLEASEVHCGVTLWNSTIWYKTSLPIAVLDLPVVSEQNRRMKFKADAVNQALKCESEAAGPLAKLEWFRHGKKVDDIPTMELDRGKSLVLFFEHINATHEGNYTCRATSAKGSIDAEFEILLDKSPLESKDGADSEEEGRRNANCNKNGRIPNLRLYHNGNGSEVDSRTSIAQHELLLLKFPNTTTTGRNCANSSGDVGAGTGASDGNSTLPLLAEEILVQVIRRVGVDPEDSTPIKIKLGSNQGHSPSLLGGDEGVNLGQGGTAGVVGTKKIGQDPKKTKDLYQYLLPFVIGLSLVLLVLILTYTTYCYFVSPWKVRRISTVSNVPLI